MREIKKKQTALVFIGTFNPPTYQPWWFEVNELIGAGTAKAAEPKIIHSQVTQFSIGWAEIQVTQNRFSITTSDEGREEAIYDLGRSTCLRTSSPVSAFGINVAAHFPVENPAVLDKIGHSLVPKEYVWKGIFKDPKTRTVAVQELREGSVPGGMSVTIEASVHTQPGIFVGINDHFETVDKTGKPLASEASMKILEDNWPLTIARSRDIIAKMLELLK